MIESPTSVPFFRPSIGEAEIREVADTLRTGWLTTGPKTKRFETLFAERVGAAHAIAVNSCTAALHLALEALDLRSGQAVLVPTMTFAATAEVVRYFGALPLLVDCEPDSLNLDLRHASEMVARLRRGELGPPFTPDTVIAGVIPVHVGGVMVDLDALSRFARQLGIWVVEDAAHAFPASWRSSADERWVRCGEHTADVTCFSFYANKTITTGEGGMAVTDDARVATRIRSMCLHGLSTQAWTRYTSEGSWDYQICAPGYKYNQTDIASSIGIHQLSRAEDMRRRREEIASSYRNDLEDVEEIERPPVPENRLSAWHLFPIRLRLDRLSLDRQRFVEELRTRGVGSSVHWRPLHLHPYYEQTFGWPPGLFPVATAQWPRLVSLPLFPTMSTAEYRLVVDAVIDICRRFSTRGRIIGSHPVAVAPPAREVSRP